jgi:two-component system nitrate/nitrite response regulator NarL
MVKILLLEDQGLVRAGMRELILSSRPNVEIVEAASGEEAIARVQSGEFEFAFLDIDLKGALNGKDVLQYIRSTEHQTKVIMLSAHSEKEVILECLGLGACGFISKEFEDESVFSDVLDTVFEGGIFIPLRRTESGIELAMRPQVRESVTLESLGVRGRTLEVLTYVCQGATNKAIARKMGVEEGTVRKDYVPKLFRVFKVSRRTELLIEVSRLGIRLPTL